MSENNLPVKFEPIFVNDFLKWGSDYQTLSELHISKWRGYSKVEIDFQRKKIRFEPLPIDDIKYSQNRSKKLSEISGFKVSHILDKDLFSIFEENEGRLLVVPYSVTMDFNEFFSKQILISIDRNFDLGDYTLSEWILFFTGNYLIFKYFEYLEIKSKKLKPYTSTIIEYIKIINSITGLSSGKINSIIKDLNFNRKGKSVLTNRPFIIMDDHIFMCPRLFNSLDPNRTLIGQLTQRKERRVYDTMINNIEKYFTQLIKEQFQVFTKMKLIKVKQLSANNTDITPDFVVFDEDSLLILDYKHFLIPVTLSEAYNKMKEIDKGVEQLAKYEKFIIENGIQELPKPINEYRIYKMLIFHFPMPLIGRDKSIYYCSMIDLDFPEDSMINIREFIDITNLRYKENEVVFSKSRNIKVSDWEYEFQQYYAPNNAPPSTGPDFY